MERPRRHPQDATQIATDLHTLLHRGHVPGPYVLAGHSLGGLYSLTFAARHPDEVAGKVLIDSTAPASAATPTAAPPAAGGSSDLTDRLTALVSTSARLGLGRLIDWPTPTYARSTIDEYGLAGPSAGEAASLRDFADTPLVVVTAGIGHDAAESAAQDALATLSTDSAHRVLDGVDHLGMILDEKGAAATTRAILDVTSSVRTARLSPTDPWTRHRAVHAHVSSPLQACIPSRSGGCRPTGDLPSSDASQRRSRPPPSLPPRGAPMSGYRSVRHGASLPRLLLHVVPQVGVVGVVVVFPRVAEFMFGGRDVTWTAAAYAWPALVVFVAAALVAAVTTLTARVGQVFRRPGTPPPA